ncbi:hypothetical protein [Mycobacterium colombiense]|uniref:hypothetical protein n=1 Tax=Mycobacterium colombiense TaxID=339268 RepID=UPI001F232DF8|nr:hypothetical protein [Mycobacterium colombiense]
MTTWSKPHPQTIDRLHVLLTYLTPASARRGLTADRAADILRQIRPRESAAKTLRSLAADLIAEIRALSRWNQGRCRHHRPGRIIGQHPDRIQRYRHPQRRQDPRRVGEESSGSAPRMHSPPTPTPHPSQHPRVMTLYRLSSASDRQLNCCIHTMAISQIS